MGVKTSWLAIKDANCFEINATLQLSDMSVLGIPQEKQLLEYHEDNEYNGRIESVLTENGWYFIVCRYMPQFIRENLDVLSIGTTLVMFELNETVMCSSAEQWCNGESTWYVDHGDLEDSHVYHLECEGELPDSFQSIRESIFAEQHKAGGLHAGVDWVIEIPSLVAKAVTGYKYDEGFTNGDAFIKETQTCLSRKTPAQLFKKYM